MHNTGIPATHRVHPPLHWQYQPVSRIHTKRTIINLANDMSMSVIKCSTSVPESCTLNTMSVSKNDV